MFNSLINDINGVLPERFSANNRERKALSNKSTKIFYDDSVSATSLSLLVLERENKDLSLNDRVIFENTQYQIYQIELEFRIFLRIFLKKDNVYAS